MMPATDLLRGWRNVTTAYVGLLVVTACDDATGIEKILGRYTLALVNGAPPPVVIEADTSVNTVCSVEERSGGSLTLSEGDRYEHVRVNTAFCVGDLFDAHTLVIDRRFNDSSAPGELVTIMTGAFTLNGDRLELVPDFTIYPRITGTVRGSTVTLIERAPGKPALNLTYRK